MEPQQHKSLVTMALLFLAFAAVGFGYVYYAHSSGERYRTNGVETQARITGKRSGTKVDKEGKSRIHQRFLEVTFSTEDGKEISGDASVNEAAFARAAEGQSVSITYVRESPADFRATSALGADPMLLYTACGMAVIGIGILVAWVVTRPARK